MAQERGGLFHGMHPGVERAEPHSRPRWGEAECGSLPQLKEGFLPIGDLVRPSPGLCAERGRVMALPKE